jgi:hypothetical protein
MGKLGGEGAMTFLRRDETNGKFGNSEATISLQRTCVVLVRWDYVCLEVRTLTDPLSKPRMMRSYVRTMER